MACSTGQGLKSGMFQVFMGKSVIGWTFSQKITSASPAELKAIR